MLLGTSSGWKKRKLGSKKLVYLLHFPIPGVMAASGALQTVNRYKLGKERMIENGGVNVGMGG